MTPFMKRAQRARPLQHPRRARGAQRMRGAPGLLLLAAAFALAACTEKPQTAHRKADDSAWANGHAEYLARGYQPSDKAAWEAQLRQRAQTQNEYPRVSMEH